MFVRHFCSNCFLENVLGTQPFADYCRRRSIPFAQQGPPATQRDSLRQWVEALGQLPPERQARVELELTRVSEVACSGALDQLLAFKPNLLLVSAGFDAYAGDPITEMTLQPEDFATFGQWLRETKIPSAAILEGGYSEKLPELIDAFLSGWIERSAAR